MAPDNMRDSSKPEVKSKRQKGKWNVIYGGTNSVDFDKDDRLETLSSLKWFKGRAS